GQHSEPLFGLPDFPIRLRQPSKYIRPFYLCPCGPPSSQALLYLRNPLLPLSLLGPRPAALESAMRQEERKALLSTKRNFRLGPLLGGLPLSAVLMEPGSMIKRIYKTIGVRQFPG